MSGEGPASTTLAGKFPEKCERLYSSWKDHVQVDLLNNADILQLSKNQQKKHLKHNIYLSRKYEKRREERLRKKQQRLELKAAGLPLPKRIKAKEVSVKESSSLKVIIDLNFVDVMSELDLKMLLKQVKTCYSDNRKADHPCQLHLTSFTGKIKDLFIAKQPGCVNWQLEFHEKCYMKDFPTENLVYLTADSDNVLQTLDTNCIYIIGGLVDHNQCKGLCHRLAIENSIQHACLPISDYIKLNSRKILTVNHVFEILLKYESLQDWKEAFFQVIPKRKGIDELSETTAQK